MAKKNSSLDLFRETISSLNQAKIHPMYVVEGDEHFFIDRFIQRVIEIIPPP